MPQTRSGLMTPGSAFGTRLGTAAGVLKSVELFIVMVFLPLTGLLDHFHILFSVYPTRYC